MKKIVYQLLLFSFLICTQMQAQVSAINLECGTVLDGTTLESSNNFNANDYAGCYNGGSDFNGPDKVFKIVKDSDFGRLSISLFSEGQDDLDIFLFDASFNNCLDASLEPVRNGRTRENIFDTDPPLPAGTYYVVVDGYNADQADDFRISAACGGVNCVSVTPLECGQTLKNQSNANNANYVNGFRVGNDFGGGNTGGERLYYFDIFFPEEVIINLNNFAANEDFELILLSDCDEFSGIAASTNPAGQAEQIRQELQPGRYYVMVDGYNGTSGTYNLSIYWNCREGAETGAKTIQCGQELQGNTVGYDNDFEIDEYGKCLDPGPFNVFEYNDALYRFEITEMQLVNIQLEVLTEDYNPEIFLMENTQLPGFPSISMPGSCLEVSQHDSDTQRSLIIELRPGTYWLSVDSGVRGTWLGAPPPKEGLFKLVLNCYDLPSPCDLPGDFITNGNTVFGEIGRAIPGEPIRELINSSAFKGIPCVESIFGSKFKLYGDIYTFYSETSAPTTIEIDNSLCKVLVFDCSIPGRNQSCVGVTSSGNNVVSFSAKAGTYYQIAVVSNEAPQTYRLSIPTPEGPCSPDTPELLTPGASGIQGDLDGFGNDFDYNNAAFYQHCSSGEFPYTGEDRLFQVYLASPLKTEVQTDAQADTYDFGGVVLETQSAMGLFLFNYLCGEQSCIASIELPEGGGKETLHFSDYTRKAGVYYLLLDQAYDSGNSDFKLTRYVNFSADLCNGETNELETHEVNFSADILSGQNIIDLKGEDKLYIDYKEKRYIGETAYETYDVPRLPGNTEILASVSLLRQRPSTTSPEDTVSALKCGFDPGDEFEFKLLKSDGAIQTLDPIFDESGIFADPPDAFQVNATTFVKSFRLKNPEQLIKVDFEPGNINLEALPPTSSTFEAHIDVNSNWNIIKSSSNDWIRIYDAQSGTDGPPLTQGQGPKKVLLQVEGNPDSEMRSGIFEIVAENGFARRVILQQLPNSCAPSAFAITEVITDVFCKGESTGGIQLTAADGLSLDYQWEDGATGATRTNLSAGNYRVSVSDEEGCATVLDYTVQEPAESLTLEITVDTQEICPGENTTATALYSGGKPTYNIRWSDGTTGSTNDNLPPGNYSVTLTDRNECTEIETFQIEAFPVQPVEILGATSFCAGGSTTLSSTGFQTYSWNTGATTESIVVTSAGTYTVVAEDTNGCTSEGSVAVEVNELPQPVITGSTTICPGGSTTLSLTGYSTYQWSTGETTASIVRSQPGTVSVTVTNSGGCAGTSSVQIEENEELQPQIVGDPDLCQGEQTVLDAGTFASYLWSTGANTRTIPVSAPGDYGVTVSDLAGCEGEDVISITVNDRPEPSINGVTFLCYGEVTVVSVEGEFNQYAWSNGSMESSTEVSTSGIYQVSVTDENGCEGTAELSVTVNPEIVLQEEVQPVSCFGANDGQINIEANGGTGNFAYHWEPELGETSTLKDLPPGVYELTVTDENDCPEFRSLEVSEPESLSLSIDSIQYIGGDPLGIITVLTSGGIAPYTYYWTWPGGFRQTNHPNSGELPTGNYEVKVEDANGCTYTLQVAIVPTRKVFLSENKLKVYPNPGEGRFFLEWNEPLRNEVEVRVTNLVGKTINKFIIPKAKQKELLNLENQPSGLYLLHLNNQEGHIIRKIIVE